MADPITDQRLGTVKLIQKLLTFLRVHIHELGPNIAAA
jgi:hypothetical protein